MPNKRRDTLSSAVKRLPLSHRCKNLPHQLAGGQDWHQHRLGHPNRTSLIPVTSDNQLVPLYEIAWCTNQIIGNSIKSNGVKTRCCAITVALAFEAVGSSFSLTGDRPAHRSSDPRSSESIAKIAANKFEGIETDCDGAGEAVTETDVLAVSPALSDRSTLIVSVWPEGSRKVSVAGAAFTCWTVPVIVKF